MDPTFAVMFVMPMAVGCLLPAVSAVCVWKTRPVLPWLVQCLALLVIVPAITAAEWMFWNIVRGAWPTMLPHLLWFAALIVKLGQIVLLRANVSYRPR